MSVEFLTSQEIVLAARRNLTPSVWGYLNGGAESETTLRRNRRAFDRLTLRPRVLVDVSSVDPSTTFLGRSLRIPVLLAPVGSLEVFHPLGGAASAQAAHRFGTMQAVSSSVAPGFEEVARSAPGPKLLQLYMDYGLDWVQEMVGRAEQAGYEGLIITVDRAIPGRGERPLLSRWRSPASGRSRELHHAAALTWESVDAIRAFTGLPFMLKGIATAENAALAVEHGINVVWVSNHGGRQLDHNRGTMDMLPEIVQAVHGRARIVLDGGIQRGTDVLKALALGADVVAVGKLQGWGLGAAGADGVVRMLDILEEEIRVGMGLLGVRRLDELEARHVYPAEPVNWPHELSSWPNLPGGRLL